MAKGTKKTKGGAAENSGDLRQWINRNAILVIVAIVLGLGGYALYKRMARADDVAAAVSRALSVARSEIGPKLTEFEKTRNRLPRGNFELEIPSRTSEKWQPLTAVELLPDGSVYMEFIDAGGNPAESSPVVVWRFKDSKYGKADTCGAQRVLTEALQRNGITCDDKVPTMEPQTIVAYDRMAKFASDPQAAAAAAAARSSLKVKRSKTPADDVIAAIGRDSDKLLEKIKSGGVDICLPDLDGRLPLAEAARSNQIKTLTALALAGCKLEQVEPYSQQTPLTVAVILRNIDATVTLLSAGANPNAFNPAGQAPLQLLGTSSDSVTMYLREGLRRRGADLNIADGSDGSTLLMRAADRGSRPLAQWLVSNGVKLDLQDGEGRTALMRAVLSTNGSEVAKLLIDAKAALNLRDASGATALGLARGLQEPERQKELETLLTKAGAGT